MKATKLITAALALTLACGDPLPPGSTIAAPSESQAEAQPEETAEPTASPTPPPVHAEVSSQRIESDVFEVTLPLRWSIGERGSDHPGDRSMFVENTDLRCYTLRQRALRGRGTLRERLARYAGADSSHFRSEPVDPGEEMVVSGLPAAEVRYTDSGAGDTILRVIDQGGTWIGISCTEERGDGFTPQEEAEIKQIIESFRIRTP